MPASQAQQFDKIGVRGVFGFFFEALEQTTGAKWIPDLSNTFESNQDIETYAGLGMSPTMREWLGAKQVKNLKELFVQIANRDFEATLRFKNKDLRRDKTGQVRARIGDFAQRALAHDALVMSAIIDGGTSTTIAIPGSSSQTIASYDGQPLWSSSHTIGSQALNNIVSPSIATAATYLGTNVGTGSTTNPSPAMMAYSIQLALNALYGFKDDQGQPLNEFAQLHRQQRDVAGIMRVHTRKLDLALFLAGLSERHLALLHRTMKQKPGRKLHQSGGEPHTFGGISQRPSPLKLLGLLPARAVEVSRGFFNQSHAVTKQV